MPVANLHFTEVGPFDEITFEFDRQVNIFTGPNNSGKSTALWVLGELLVYPFTMPAKLIRADPATWRLDLSPEAGVGPIEGHLPAQQNNMLETYRVIGYTCFVPAQRHGTDFRSSGPTAKQDIESRANGEAELIARERPTYARQIGIEALRQLMRGSRNLEDPILARRRNLLLTGSSLVSDEAVIQKMIDLDYAAYRRNRPGMRAIVENVISMASDITEAFPIAFLGIEEDEGGLFPLVSTLDGNLPLDVLSQGTQSLIQWLARLLFGYAEYYDFPPDLKEKPGVLIIDEIDAHLHPSWQRRVIPTLTNYFPKLQIFCSTHSPLMLGGLKAGQVQLLRRGPNGKVTVSGNESDIVGWTADEILRNFLDIQSPTDSVTAGHVSRLQELRRRDELSAEEAQELEELRHAISRELLNGPGSAQVEQFAEELKRARVEPISGSGPPTTPSRRKRRPGKSAE